MLEDLLRQALPKMDVKLTRDLWPRMPKRPAPAISRLDWALIAAVIAWVVVFPQSVLALLYHL